MPELHPNQIQWQAPEPTTVQFDKQADLISPQIQRLGETAERLAETKAKIDDVEFSERMKQEVATGLQQLQLAKHSDANYEQERAALMDRVQATLMSAPEDVRTRFARNNPEYLNNVWVDTEDIILKKVQAQLGTNAKLMIPDMASNVVQGAASYDDVKKQLEEMTANLDPSVSAELLFTLDDEIARGNIESLVLAKRYSDADKLVDMAVTLTPGEKIRYKKYIQSTADANAKAEAELQKKLTSGTKGDEDAVEAQLMNSIYRAWQRNPEDAYRIIRALETNEDIELSVYDDNGKVKETVVMNANEIAPTLAFKVARTARNNIEATDEWLVQNARAEADISNLEANVEYALKNKDETGANYFSALYDMKDYVDSVSGGFLSNESIKRANKTFYTNIDAKREAAMQPEGLLVYTGMWRNVEKEAEVKNVLNSVAPRIMEAFTKESASKAPGEVVDAMSLYKKLPADTQKEIENATRKYTRVTSDREVEKGISDFIAMTVSSVRLGSLLPTPMGLLGAMDAGAQRFKNEPSLSPLPMLRNARWGGAVNPTQTIVNALGMPDGSVVDVSNPSMVAPGNRATDTLQNPVVAVNLTMRRYLQSLPEAKQPRKGETTAFLTTTAATILSAVGQEDALDAIGLPTSLTQDDVLTAMERTWAWLEKNGIDHQKLSRDDDGTDAAMQIEKVFYDMLLPRGNKSRVQLTPEQEQERARIFMENRLDTLNGAGTLEKSIYVPSIEIKNEPQIYPTVLGARLAKEAKK